MEILWIWAVLAGHYIADFILQNDKMATRKSSSIWWLDLHVLVYMLGIAPLGVILFIMGRGLTMAIGWVVVNGILHWAVDSITSKINVKLWKEERRHEFFCMIGFDQLIHYGCLFTTWGVAIGVLK